VGKDTIHNLAKNLYPEYVKKNNNKTLQIKKEKTNNIVEK
jgi:hypothetical protein